MKVTVLSPVEHDGKAYAEGDQIEIKAADQIEALERVGAGRANRKAAAPAPVPAAEADTTTTDG